jgi:hypothetical protein
VYDRYLKRLRESVRVGDYVMTLHAQEEMSEDDLTVFDVENAVLCGCIIGRQRDRATGEQKYLVRGEPVDGSGQVVVVTKLGFSGRMAIITVYRDQ